MRVIQETVIIAVLGPNPSLRSTVTVRGIEANYVHVNRGMWHMASFSTWGPVNLNLGPIPTS